jgi:hypothetical protein
MVALSVLVLGAALFSSCVEWDAMAASDSSRPFADGLSYRYRSESHLLFGHGLVAVQYFGLAQDHPFTAEESSENAWAMLLSMGRSRIWPTFSRWPTGNPSLAIPCWTPLLIFVPLAFYLVRRDRWLSRPGRCEKCGYDRRGLAAGASACPECGTVPAPAAK